MDYSLEEAEFARRVLTRGKKRIVVTDRSKFGRTALVKVCGFADFDILITDHPPPGELGAALAAGGVKTVLAG